MNELMIPALEMTSKEIAEMTGKEHRNVLRDIDVLRRRLPTALASQVTTGEYGRTKDNRGYRVLTVPPDVVSMLLDRYSGIGRYPHRLQEEAALKTIEQLLGIELIRQYPAGKYRVDGYHAETDTAYEIDEVGHDYHRPEDAARREEISKELGCKFVVIRL